MYKAAILAILMLKMVSTTADAFVSFVSETWDKYTQSIVNATATPIPVEQDDFTKNVIVISTHATEATENVISLATPKPGLSDFTQNVTVISPVATTSPVTGSVTVEGGEILEQTEDSISIGASGDYSVTYVITYTVTHDEE